MEAISLGLFLCSIAFAIAVIYLSIVLRRVANVTKTLGKTIKEAERYVEQVLPQLHNTLKETRNTVDEMEGHLHTADHLIDTVHNVGKSVQHLNEAYGEYKESVTDKSFQQQIKAVVEGIKWGEAVDQVISKR